MARRTGMKLVWPLFGSPHPWIAVPGNEHNHGTITSLTSETRGLFGLKDDFRLASNDRIRPREPLLEPGDGAWLGYKHSSLGVRL